MASKFGGVAVDEKPTTGSKFGGVAAAEEELVTSKPSLGENVYGGAVGLASGLLGTVGDIESMVTTPSKDPKLRGYETVFPTSENVKTGFKKLGLPKPAPGTEASVRLGELVPAIAGGAQLAKTLGGYGITKAADLAKRLTGGKQVAEAEKAVKGLQTSIPATLSEAGKTATQKAATETEAEYLKRARQEQNLREAEKRTTTAAQQEREAAAQKYSDLGKPSDTAKLGDEMQRRLSGTEFRRAGERSRQAKNDAEAYFAEAKAKGQFVKSDEGKLFVKNLQNKIFSQASTPAERKIAEDMYLDLQSARDIEAVEKTFRRFKEKASGPPKEGYDAVLQQFAGKLSEDLSQALNKFSPKRLEFRNTYRDLSTPLDAYETSFGAKPLATEKKVEGQLQMMPTDYPAYFFKNRDTINVLRQQLAGDEAAVRKFANQHAVNELQGKTADQAAAWLNKNSEWVNTVEGLNTRVARYVDSLKQAETQAARLEQQAKKIGGKAEEVVKARQARETEIATATEAQKTKLSEFKEQLNLSPDKAPAVAENMIQYLSKNKLLPFEKLRLLKADVDAANKLKDAVQRQKELRKAFIYYGVISAGGGYGTYKLGQYVF